MARKDIINQNGVPNWDAIAGFKERLDDHDGSLAQNTSQLNSIRIDAKHPPAPFVACKGDGVTDDTDAINALVSYLNGLGGGTLYFPAGTYIVQKQTGTVQIPAHDDGTVQSGYGSPMSPETVYSMPYSVKIYQNVRLLGHDENVTIFKGNYTYGNADLNQLIMFAYTGSDVGVSYCGLERLQIQNAFFGYAILNTTLATTNFLQLKIMYCAIGIYVQRMERCHFEEVVAGYTGTMLVVGGQWWTRNNQKSEQGGWADKNYFNKISFQYIQVMGTADNNIDTFFDTYFFKTANNSTRLSSAIDPSSPATALVYKGICGTCINFLPRYFRPCNSNSFNNIFHAVAPRYMFYGGDVRASIFYNINIERCGYQNSNQQINPIGNGYNDPYLGSGVKIPSFIVGTDNSCQVDNIQVQSSYCQQVLDNNVNYRNLNFQGDTAIVSLPTSRNSNQTLTTPTINTPTISGGSITSGITANYHFIGDNINWITSPVSGGSASATMTLPENGVYLINVLVSSNASYDQATSQAGIVTWFVGGVYQVLGADMIGTAHKAAGTHAPTSISLSAPTAGGVVTATASGTDAANLTFRFDVTKLSKQ